MQGVGPSRGPLRRGRGDAAGWGQGVCDEWGRGPGGRGHLNPPHPGARKHRTSTPCPFLTVTRIALILLPELQPSLSPGTCVAGGAPIVRSLLLRRVRVSARALSATTGVRRPLPLRPGTGPRVAAQIPGARLLALFSARNTLRFRLARFCAARAPPCDVPPLRLTRVRLASPPRLCAPSDRCATTDPASTLPLPCHPQTRTVCCFPDGQGFAVGSVEGRVAMEYFDPSEESQARGEAC